MASFLKILARPCLQLLVLALVLGAGLLPKNSMAQDNPGASAANDSPVSSAEGPADAKKASDRADTSPVKWVECWNQTCTGKDDCDKKPAEAGATKENCPTGYYYQKIQGKGGSIVVRRGCALKAEKACLMDKPESCMKYETTGNSKDDTGSVIDYIKCLNQNSMTGIVPDLQDLSKKGKSGSGIRCVCNTTLCNERTTSESAGVKHLGSNVALVGALLVAVSPLWTMFLIG